MLKIIEKQSDGQNNTRLNSSHYNDSVVWICVFSIFFLKKVDYEVSLIWIVHVRLVPFFLFEKLINY